jgi:peroxiredoxin
MTEKSAFLKTQLWSVILIVLVLVMGVEILLLVQENRELRVALKAPGGSLKILNPKERVPPLSGIDQKGEEVKVEYPSSKKTVLFWFSTECPSCEYDLEFWKQIYQKHSLGMLRFFGVTSSDEDKTKEFIKKFQLEFPVLVLSDFSLLEKYRVEVIPQTMLIDTNGMVQKVWPGSLSENYKKEIEAMIFSSSKPKERR